jgi:hypothetical protein
MLALQCFTTSRRIFAENRAKLLLTATHKFDDNQKQKKMMQAFGLMHRETGEK